MKPSKELFKEYIATYCQGKKKVTILDLGSGTSNNFIELIKRFPQIDYTGVEPYGGIEEAKKALAPYADRARIITGLGYDVPEIKNQTFDIVCSLSVLEHVKFLEKFLAFSATKVTIDGEIIHLWDNAHALIPISIKERVQVFISQYAKWIIPSSRYVNYVDCDMVARILTTHGITSHRFSFHNCISSLKAIGTKKFATQEAIKKINDFEQYISQNISKADNKKIFMTQVVWSKK